MGKLSKPFKAIVGIMRVKLAVLTAANPRKANGLSHFLDSRNPYPYNEYTGDYIELELYNHPARGIEGFSICYRYRTEKEAKVMNRILSFIAVLALAGSLALSPWPALMGNVQVSVVNGNLIIQGDNSDNNIIITEGNITGRANTTINGGRSIFPPDGVTGDIVINMNGGNDFVRIELPGTNFAVVHDLRIYMGAGNDFLELLQVKVPEETRINTAGGHDVIFIDGVFSAGAFNRSEFTGKFHVRTGNGDDLLEFHNAIFSGQVDVALGSGIDAACSTEDSEFQLPDQAIFNGGLPSGFPGDGFVAPITEFIIVNFEFFPDDCSFIGGRF